MVQPFIQRQSNVIWFNSPYSDSIETNIGKEFFRLLSKHFPSHLKLRKICNKNCVKLTYSCMPNVAAIIFSCNKELLLRKKKQQNQIRYPATAELCIHLADFYQRINVFVKCTLTHFWFFHCLLQENHRIFGCRPTHQNLRGNTATETNLNFL